MRTIHLDDNVTVEARLSKCLDEIEPLVDELNHYRTKYYELLQEKMLHEAAYINSLNTGWKHEYGNGSSNEASQHIDRGSAGVQRINFPS